MAKVIDSFTTSQAQRLTGFSRRQIGIWIEHGLIIPSVRHSQHKGATNRFSLRDLVCLKVIASLRKQGVSLGTLDKIAEEIRKYNDASWTNLFLTYDGTDVCLKDGQALISLWRHPGQMVFLWVVPLGNVEKELRSDISKMAA